MQVTQKRIARSPARRGTSAVHSRNASHDTSPKSTATPGRPNSSASVQPTTMTHHARSRALRLATARRVDALDPAMRAASLQPTSEAVESNPNTPPSSQRLSGSVRPESGAKNLAMKFQAVRRLLTAARARERKSNFSSSGPSRTGAPKLSPPGRNLRAAGLPRCSMKAGTSSTSGRSRAR